MPKPLTIDLQVERGGGLAGIALKFMGVVYKAAGLKIQIVGEDGTVIEWETADFQNVIRKAKRNAGREEKPRG